MSGYCTDCGNTMCLCSKMPEDLSEIIGIKEFNEKYAICERESVEQLKSVILDLVEGLEWIAKTDTASHVHGPNVIWLSNWRNTRKQAASNLLSTYATLIESLRSEK